MYVLIHKTTLDLKYIAVHCKETLDNAKDISFGIHSNVRPD
jgi:hypothetical protein